MSDYLHGFLSLPNARHVRIFRTAAARSERAQVARIWETGPWESGIGYGRCRLRERRVGKVCGLVSIVLEIDADDASSGQCAYKTPAAPPASSGCATLPPPRAPPPPSPSPSVAVDKTRVTRHRSIGPERGRPGSLPDHLDAVPCAMRRAVGQGRRLSGSAPAAAMPSRYILTIVDGAQASHS